MGLVQPERPLIIDTTPDILFSPLLLRHMMLPNRLIRSATYEAMAGTDGVPQPELSDLYVALARGGVGTIITGFAHVSPAGRAASRQCGIDDDEKIAPWQQLVAQVRDASSDVKLLMQLHHAGRQTLSAVTGRPVVGASTRRCSYFRQQVQALTDDEIRGVIRDFAAAAARAHAAGFDGIQLHAAHGYLLHQFLSPWTNTRGDRWREPTLLLEEIIGTVRERCGDGFPIWVKISAGEDTTPGLRLADAIRTVQRLETLQIDAVEVSYGTMEYALNTIRGGIPVDTLFAVNPMFSRVPGWLRWLLKRYIFPSYRKRFRPFSANYNVKAAAAIKRETTLPVIAVGGIRTLEGMRACLTTHGLDAVALCRPLVCEPDLPAQIRRGTATHARCGNCNLCTIHCTASHPIRCYRQNACLPD